jgi:hypothetical protein
LLVPNENDFFFGQVIFSNDDMIMSSLRNEL